jgi:beta-lactamase superfamily II metal-dependent hydrolase
MKTIGKKLAALVLALVLLLPAAGFAQVAPDKVFDRAEAENKLAVWFLSLTGEDHTGESILIRTPGGHTILVDGGTPEAGAQVNDALDALGITGLDVVVGTHMHIDHIGGLAAVLDKHRAGTLYVSPFTAYQTSAVSAFKEAAARQGLPLTTALAGDSFVLDGVTVELLYPFEAYGEVDEKNVTGQFLNDSSLVFMLTYQDKKLLFPGDVTRTAEQKLIERYGGALKADVLKVGHHGSSDASGKAFVETVAPADSVMCIYAFNDFSVYDRFKKLGNRPYVTSLDGTVLYVTDGENGEFYTMKERKGLLK